jgi:hypothetical protein
MGCCASGSGEDDVLMQNQTSSAVTCRAGLKGENVKVEEALKGGSYAVQGTGTMLGSCCLDCDTGMWEVKVGKNPEGLRIGIKKYHAKTAPGKLFEHLDSTADARSPAWFLDETVLKEGDVVGICESFHLIVLCPYVPMSVCPYVLLPGCLFNPLIACLLPTP